MRRTSTTHFLWSRLLRRLSFLGILGLSGGSAFGAFNGTYTLNPAAPASATNYQNMVSFAQDLYGGARTDGGPVNGAGGVTGPVVLRLATGITLTEQVEFRTAPGASAVNTITIKGSNSTLQYTATVATSKHTIWMNGAKFYTIDSLRVLANSATLAWGIRFSNDANNNRILNSSVLVPNITSGVTTSTSSTSTQAAICFTASSSILDYTPRSSACMGKNGANNLVSGCVLGGVAANSGPTYAVYEMQTDTTGNNSYTNNKIQYFYVEGIAIHTGDGITITGNDFNRTGSSAATTTIKGVNLYYNVRSDRNPITVNNNIIHDFKYAGQTVYGIYYYNNTQIANYDGGKKASTINNNKIYDNASTSFYGIYCYYTRNAGGLTVNNNEIYNNVFTGTTYCIYGYYNTKNTYNANVIRNNKAATQYCIYNNGSPVNSNITNNLVYKNIATGAEYGLYIGGSGTAWIGNNYSNNTIAFDSVGWSSGTTYGIYMTAGSATVPRSNNNVFNNSVYIAHKGTSGTLKYGFYNLWGYTGYTEEHNNIYFDAANVAPATTYFGSDFAGPLINFPTLTDWSNFGYSNKDHNLNPQFAKTTYKDYAFKNYNLNNVGSNASLTQDILGTARIVGAPDVGAVEVIFDVQVTAVGLNKTSVCAGFTDSVKITLKNNSPYKVYRLPLGVSVNNTLQATYTTATGDTINPSASRTFTFPSSLILLSKVGNNTVKHFISNNDIPSNDTLTKTVVVEAAPGGGVISKQPASKGIENYLGKNYDVSAYDEIISYDMSPPKKYTNSQYGTSYTATVTVLSPGGQTLPGSYATLTHPSSTVITLKPTIAHVDSMLKMLVRVKDLITGCDTTYTRYVFIAPKGKPAYKIPASICEGDAVLFDNYSTVSSGSLAFTWNFGDTSAPDDNNTPSHVYKKAGTYNVTLHTVTVPYGYVRDSVFKVTVKEVPKVKFMVDNACEGTAVKFTNQTTATGSGTAYEWNFGDGSPVSAATSPSKNYNAGTYTVTLKATLAGCSAVVSKETHTYVNPEASFTVTAANFCDNENFSFKNTSTIASGSYGIVWDFNDNNVTSTEENPVYDFTTAGTKNVKITLVSDFGCADSSLTTVEVKPAPKSDFSYPSACTIDPTKFANLTIVPAGKTAFYAWDFGDGSAISNAKDPVHGWSLLGPKTITLTTSLNNGCKDQAVKQLTVGTQPIVDFEAADHCVGDPVEFRSTSTWKAGTATYKWSFGDGKSSTLPNPVHDYPNVTNTQTINVKLTVAINGGCEDSVVKAITISEGPAACDFNITYDGTTGHRNYKFTPAGGALTDLNFYWLTGDGANRTSFESGTFYNYGSDGNYIVTMYATNQAGCECSKSKVLPVSFTSVEDIAAGISLSVFPNPNNGRFTVKIDGADSDTRISVYNLLGELLQSQHVVSGMADMDLSSYANGIYLLKAYHGNTVLTQKVTVNR